MIFPAADDSHEISCLIFVKFGNYVGNLSSAAVVIGTLRVNAFVTNVISSTYQVDKFISNLRAFWY